MILLAGRQRAVGPALACMHAAGSSVEWHGSAEFLSTAGRLSAMVPPVSDPPPGVMASLSQLCVSGWVMDRGFASSAAAANTAEAQSTAVPTTPPPGNLSRGASLPNPLETGHLYQATVTGVRQKLAELDVVLPSPSGGDPSIVKACMPIGHLTQERVEDMSTVFTVGEKIKVLAVGRGFDSYEARVGTKYLEPQPGAMLTDKQAVFDGAEKRAAEYLKMHTEKEAKRQAFKARVQVGDVLQAEYIMRAEKGHLLAVDGNLFRMTSLGSRGPVRRNQIISVVVKDKSEDGGLRFAAHST